MMQYELGAIIVTDQGIHLPTGLIGRWRADVQRDVERRARELAPTNKRRRKSRRNSQYPVGSLKRSIRGSQNPMSLRVWNIEVSANTPYALYVHEGTRPVIRGGQARAPKGAVDERGRKIGGQYRSGFGVMYVPPGMGFGAMLVNRVSGQEANPFLTGAIRAASAEHPSLR